MAKKSEQPGPGNRSNEFETAADKRARQRAEARKEAQEWAERKNAEGTVFLHYVTEGRDNTPRLWIAGPDHPIMFEEPGESEAPNAV